MHTHTQHAHTHTHRHTLTPFQDRRGEVMVAHDEDVESEDDDEEGGVEAEFEGVLRADVSDSLISMPADWYGIGRMNKVV